jgi:dipeptidyl aminopeptidase/acylaminoacyl peptidase
MQSEKISRQFGLWDSPITPISLAGELGLLEVSWDSGGALAWLERRSDRGVIVLQSPDGQAPRDLNGDFSVRGRVGYGGGDFTTGYGDVYFVAADSGRIFCQPIAGGFAIPLTPGFGQMAAPQLSPDGRWLVFVHSYEGQDYLEIVDQAGTCWPQKLVTGNDFYMQPAWHPDSFRLAWIAWDHPNMPWDNTWLRMGSLNFNRQGLPVLEGVQTIAGELGGSIFQPQFSPDGRYLAYVSDASGWWQLYLYDLTEKTHRQMTSMQAEHGSPAWIQGMRTYDFSPDSAFIYVLRNKNGFVSLWQVSTDEGEELRLPLDGRYTYLEQIKLSPSGQSVALLASGGSQPKQVIQYDLREQAERILRRSTPEEMPSDLYALPEPIEWLGMDGGKVYGLFYAPKNPRFEGIGKPPLILLVHGGPTSQQLASFSTQVQFFTSRGYAVLLVNYRGSSGYGRAYREMLRGSWGIYDVQDSVSGAEHLVKQGLVDGARMVIMGGSAGGFTVLKSLEDYPGFFKAGICLYGVSNQFTLLAETHKFEAFYSYSMLGPLPQAADIYRERSPIFFADKISDPLAVFQGEIDQVVPRKQSDDIVESLKQRGIPHIYRVYPGEGHGFRKSETIEDFYKTVEAFLRQYVIYS